MEVNCAEACVNGCILGEQCPHLQYREAAAKFISETSMDQILEIAAESVRKKMTQAPERYLPDLPHWQE
jgi:hypothetical protein